MGGRSKRMHHTTMRPFTIPHPPFQEQSRMKANQPSPWMWIPTLYFAEGIPYFIVNSISVTMFTKMGVPNGEMALFTSLLYLPWTIKPLWSPFVDILKTKRWWILSMQILMSVAFILITGNTDFTLYVHINLIHSNGLCFGYTRYRRRWFLHVGTKPATTKLFCRYQKYFLSSFLYLRTRCFGLYCWLH